ncbi:MAG: type II toxin-antitoxin system RelE/ParE family toxin [bacterium]|nr:type II toxin-antitoxin system RelE/ParE family toxin [bacterium]
MYELEYFVDHRERAPFIEWKQSLNIKTQARIDSRLDRVGLGLFGDCKPIARGIYELRFHFEGGLRLYFAKIQNTIILLLAGGNKKTQKRDIENAHRNLKIYKEANK